MIKFLIKKILSKLGVKGQVLFWVSNWLKTRKQTTGANGHFTKWKVVTIEISQDSFLGQMLFNIFINDLESGITSRIFNLA